MEQKFETPADFFEDEKYQESVRNKIDQLAKSFEERGEPKAGMKWKRTWYDRFTDENPFTYEFFMGEIDKVLLKESKLKSEAREVLLSIHGSAIVKTLNFYHKQKEATV